jgi:hypothetical protein
MLAGALQMLVVVVNKELFASVIGYFMRLSETLLSSDDKTYVENLVEM